MTKINQQLLLWLIVIALTVAGGMVIINTVQPDNTIKPAKHEPDAFMTQLNYQAFNKKGKLQVHLKAPEMSHYPLDNSSQFLKPNVVMYTDGGIPWHVSADHGRSKQGSKKIYLWGHVVIHQPNRPGLPETTITTSQMTVYPDKQYAETNKDVVITRPGSKTSATGLQADFKTGIFKLLSNSRGHYAPNAE